MLELLKIKKDINWLVDQVRCLVRKKDLDCPLSATEWSPNHSTALGNPYILDCFVWFEGHVYKSLIEDNQYPPINDCYWQDLGTGHLLLEEQSDWDASTGRPFIRNKPTRTSEFINDGEDGTTPFITTQDALIPTLQSVTDAGDTTTKAITADSFIKSGGTGTNILLDDGDTVSISSIGGNTNLSISQTTTNFTITSDTGDDAIVPLGNGTLAGATLNDYTTAEKTKLTNTSGTNTGDNATNTTSNAYADAKVSDTAYDATSWNGITTIAPSKNAIRDKIQATGLQEITNINASTTNPISVNVTGVVTGVYGFSPNGVGVNGYSKTYIGVDGYSETGIGVQGYSETSVGGNFDTDAVSANIVNFKKGGVIKAAVQNDGKITATAGTVSTDVVVKSQLDTKQDAITFTTTGTSGAATLTGSALNIPQYSGATNLGYTPSPTNGTVTSNTGDDAILPLADGTNAGLFTPAEKTKLSGIATGATVGVVPNAAITGATNTKITYDSKGLVTAGTSLIATDIPTITQAQVTNLTTDLAAKAPLLSPAFTGNPTATTQSPLNNSTRLATTAYVEAACAVVANSGGVKVSPQEDFYTTANIATVTAAEYAGFVTAGTVSSTTLYFITA